MARNLTSIMVGLLLACSAQAQNITGYEYWFDQNDAARTYVPVTPSATVTLANAQLNTTGLSLGQHQACLRWKDQPAAGQARWSSVVCRTLQVGQPGPWEIVAVRYWVGTPANDADPLIRYKYFDTPQTELIHNGLLELCDYPTGSQTLKFQLLDNHDQWSSVVTRSVLINAAGALGIPVITASTSTFCPGDAVTFTATPQTGAGFATPTGFDWQIPTTPGWSAVPSNGNTIVVTIGQIGGAVQATATNLCGQSAPGSFTVNVQTFPDQPAFITGPLQACIGSTVTYGTPLVPGISYAWSISGGWTDSGGPGATFETGIGNANATISVTPTNSCGDSGPPRIETIVVAAPPSAGDDGSMAICSDGDTVNLFSALQGSPQVGGVWRLNGVLVPDTYNPSINSPGVYTYTVSGSGPCPDATANVVVTEPQAPNAGFDAAITVCSNVAPFAMGAQLGGSPDGGGNWSGPSVTNGTFEPATMSPGDYTYTVNGIAPCGNASAALTIAVQQAPNAGVGGILELCDGSSPVTLVNSLGGNPALNGAWTDPDGQPFVGIFTPGANTEGNYTYTVQGTGACADAQASLDVQVMHLTLVAITGPDQVPAIEPLTFNATPSLADADSIIWTLPSGWIWSGDPNQYDAEALVLPDSTTGQFSICAQAVGGLCDGNLLCDSVNVTVGVAELMADGAGLLIFPNPNDGRFSLRLPSAQDRFDVQVLDATGREVALLMHRGGVVAFDLPGLPSGTYLLRWATEEQSGSRPMVIAR